MAASGTCTAFFNNMGAWSVSVAGVTDSTNCVPFTLKEYTASSFQLSGTFSTATVQWQGSNDGGTTWTNIGVPLTSASPAAGTLTPGMVFFGLYQFTVTGGDGTTSINARLRAVISR